MAINVVEARSREAALAEQSKVATVGLVFGVLGSTAIVFGLVLYVLDPGVVALSVLNLGFGAAALTFYAVSNGSSLMRAVSGRSTVLVMLEVVIGVGVLAALAASNYFAAKSPIEWDLTRDSLYTLQPQSVEVAKRLSQSVRFVGFYQPTDPARAMLEQAIELYRRHTEKISLEFINPTTAPPAVVKEYQMTPSSPRIVLVGEKGLKTKFKTPSEDEITNALVKIAEQSQRKIFFLTGHGEPSIEDAEGEEGYKRASDDLVDEGYAVESIALLDKEILPADATVLVITGSRSPLLPNEVNALQAYVSRGGRALILLEPGLDAGLDSILSAYGLDVGDNLIVEPNPASRAFGYGPDAPLVREFEQHPITSPLKGSAALFYWTRSVLPHPGTKDIEHSTLIRTGPNSWAESQYRSGLQAERDEADIPGPVPIAVALSQYTAQVPGKLSDQARMVVFGDSSFPNNHLNAVAGNGDLFVNSINWLAGDEDKITIRPKARGASRLPLTETQQYAIMFFSVNLLPLIIIGFGFSVWAVRRRK